MSKLFFFFFLITNVIFAQQNDKIIYLDSLGIQTTKGNHKIYRLVEDYYLTKSKYKVLEYFASEKLKKSGYTTKKESFKEEGEIYNYFESGAIKSIFSYQDGFANGKCIYWYENGTKKLEGNYSNKKESDKVKLILKVDNFWDEKNNQLVTNGEGEMIDTGEFEILDADFDLISNGKIKNGFKDGEWKGNYKKDFLSFTEFYDKGKLVSGSSKDRENIEYTYTEIRHDPEVKGGIANFYKYVQKNFVQAENLKIGGTILTRFVVNKEGTITDSATIKGVRTDVDSEAIRIISNFKGFSPAIYRGKKVKCSYTLPITIQAFD
jgi:antitoxin component YwqK of YwqJK toxin-antitoxin module